MRLASLMDNLNQSLGLQLNTSFRLCGREIRKQFDYLTVASLDLGDLLKKKYKNRLACMLSRVIVKHRYK